MGTDSLSSTISTLKENEVYLGGIRLPIRGRIQLVKATQHPGKISIGKITRADQVLADEWIQNDWRDGMLIYYLDETLHTGRFFWSTTDTRWLKKMMLPPLVTTIGNPTSSAADTLISFNGALHASFAGVVYKWDDNTGWGSSLHTLGGIPTSAVVWNNKLYFAMSGSGYWVYDPTGPTWTQYGTPHVLFFSSFDVNPSQKLMEIDNTGLIQASVDGVTWSPQVGGQVTDPTTVTGLISYRDAADNPSLFVATTTGLYNVDVWTQTVYKTSLQVLTNADNGKHFTIWSDGNLYYPNGLSLWRYPKGGDIVNIGLDKDEGLPVFIRGHITNLAYHPTFLIAVVDATKVTGTATTVPVAEPVVLYPDFNTAFLTQSQAQGFSAILAYNDQGWHNLYLSSILGTGIPSLCLDTSYNNSERRLFFCDGVTVKYIAMPEGNYNPALDPNAKFDPQGTFTTAWFDGGYTEIVKLAVSMKVRALGITSTETIAVSYAINDSTVFNSLGTVNASTIDSGGRAIFHFNLPSGLQFYNIQFQFQFNRGSDNTLSPEMLFFDLRFKRLPAVLWGWTFTVVGTDPEHLTDSWQQIKAMCEARLTYLFAFQANADTTLQPVEIVGVTGIQYAGDEKTSYYTVTLIELEKDTPLVGQ